jgi:hypothetical protein
MLNYVPGLRNLLSFVNSGKVLWELSGTALAVYGCSLMVMEAVRVVLAPLLAVTVAMIVYDPARR